MTHVYEPQEMAAVVARRFHPSWTPASSSTVSKAARSGERRHPRASLRIQIHSRPPFRIESTSIDAIVVSGNSAKIFGTATAGGSSGVVFRLDLVDNVEPGKTDTFRLRTSDGVDSLVAMLGGGNIPIKP